MSYISTGIDNIDREIGGGIPTGQVSVVSAPSDSDAEKFAYQIMSANTDQTIIYITLNKNKEIVEHIFDRSKIILNSSAVQVGDYSGDTNTFEEITSAVKQLPEESIVIIDSSFELEQRKRDNYRNFLNKIQVEMIEKNCNAIFLSLGEGGKNDNLTLQFADSIMKIVVESTGRDEENHFLSFPKFRDSDELNERYRLRLKKDLVKIDSSRDIS